jgi:hypothetical protein
MSSNPENAPSYWVAVYASPDDPEEFADVLIDVLQMHRTDALIQARRLPGFLSARLAHAQAERLVAAIQATGLRAELVPEAEVPEFGHGEAVHHVKCTAEGLEILEVHGQTAEKFSWPEIDLICVGAVPQAGTLHFSLNEDPFLSAARHSPHAPLETPSAAALAMWLVTRSPLRAFHIDSKKLNYEYLGDRKTESATLNFQTFLQDLLQHALQAFVTHSTRAFLNHEPVETYQFETADQLRRSAQFFLLIHRHPRN